MKLNNNKNESFNFDIILSDINNNKELKNRILKQKIMKVIKRRTLFL